MAKHAVIPGNAPTPIGPYSPGIVAPATGRTLYVSGQVAIDPATQQFVAGDAAAQADQAIRNLQAVLEAAGGTLDDLVKTTIYLRDMADFPAVNAVYARYLSQPYPARATVAVSGLPRDAAVEIDGVAVIG